MAGMGVAGRGGFAALIAQLVITRYNIYSLFTHHPSTALLNLFILIKLHQA